jgi:GAF domain-containing protein
VGEDAVQFKNPDLPLTRSEMALPLISRDEVIGALTVQSIQPGAFSIADTTFLQMMADQLANAIKNARLFQEINQAINEVSLAQSEAEERLQETIALQQLSQALSSTLNTHEILDIFFRACTNLIGFDYIIFSQVNKKQNRMRVLAAKGVSDRYIQQTECALDSHHIVTDILQTGRFEVIRGWDERLDRETFDAEKQTDWTRLYIPISLRQENVGLVEAGFKKPGIINETQTNLIRAFIDQTILALDNAQRYELSQKQARRETLIKEITTRVWASNDVDTILRTTVKELGNALNSKRSYAHLTSSNPNVIVDRE